MDILEEWNTRADHMIDLLIESYLDIVESELQMDDGELFNGGKND